MPNHPRRRVSRYYRRASHPARLLLPRLRLYRFRLLRLSKHLRRVRPENGNPHRKLSCWLRRNRKIRKATNLPAERNALDARRPTMRKNSDKSCQSSFAGFPASRAIHSASTPYISTRPGKPAKSRSSCFCAASSAVYRAATHTAANRYQPRTDEGDRF